MDDNDLPPCHALPVKKTYDWISGRRPTDSSSSVMTFTRNMAVLDYILAHARGDVRPYLNVDIYGQRFLALLDSGASRTFIGGCG